MPRKTVRVPCRHEGHEHEVEVEVEDTGEPEADQRAEAAHFVRTLADNRQIAEGPGPHKAGETHVIETGPDGVKRLKRRGFNAV